MTLRTSPPAAGARSDVTKRSHAFIVATASYGVPAAGSTICSSSALRPAREGGEDGLN